MCFMHVHSCVWMRTLESHNCDARSTSVPVCASTFTNISILSLIMNDFAFFYTYSILPCELCSVHKIIWSTKLRNNWKLKTRDGTSSYNQSLSTTVQKLNFDVCSIEPNAIYTRTVLTTSTFSSGKFHWHVASYTLPDANKNSEKKTMNCNIR